jgi:SAM-dependent methyltransferase
VSAAASKWGARAAQVYDEAYAERYRRRDEAARDHEAIVGLGQWLTAACERFSTPIDVLDLGCGTGRYFRFVRGARHLVGVDVSKPMLDLARHPVGVVSADSVQLVAADFLRSDFEPGRFDLIYSIGVLAEHVPFDGALAARVRSWLRPGGRFALTAVDVSCPSIPRTRTRRAAEWAMPLAGPFRQALRARLLSGGLYADRQLLHDVLVGAGFAVESLEPFPSDVHLHLLAVARNAE